MTYTWTFSDDFANQFQYFPEDQQNKVINFIDIFTEHGLGDFSLYEGKISSSFSGNYMDQDDYNFALNNHLWHYHIGIPEYEQNHSKYKTSDWVLHFQWFDQCDSINIVDLYHHYDNEGNFYLPTERSLIILK